MDATGQVPGGGPLVVFDLDGTLLDGRTIHHLCERYDVLGEARRFWHSEDRGPTSVGPRVKRQVAGLFEGIPVREVEQAVAQLPFHAPAHDVVEALRGQGCTMGVVTGSYHPAADRARRELMLDFGVGVELAVNEATLTGALVETGYEGPCGEWVCKRDVLETHAHRYEATTTIAIGDGLNDVCMLEHADLGIAVEGAAGAAKAASDRVAPLADVPALVQAHLDTRAQAAHG